MKVSILIPCYNVEQYLSQCLDSVMNQTHQDLQIVLVDDGSRDNTLAIAQRYAAKDSRIEVYHQENQGVAAARNVLLSKIKGDYFFFVDSDDWIEQNMVQFLLSQATGDDVDMVTCGIVSNSTPVETAYSSHVFNRKEAIERFLYHIEFRGSLCNKLFKTTLLSECHGFQKDISFGEDALFCWEWLNKSNVIVYTDRQLYHYRMLSDSLTHGAFNSKKFSGHKVWNQLCEDTEKIFPEFKEIAYARFCIESTLLLRDAAHCGYKQMDEVLLLQDTVKKHWNCLNKVSITSVKMKIYAYLACRNYWLASKI